MTKLTIDPHYTDSYSECGSSSSSFSHGPLTPGSLTDWSAATSRRQSIASEGQSSHEGAFDRVPNFSRNKPTTSLRTPPPFRQSFRPVSYSLGQQGYDADFSPIETQQQRSVEASSMSVGPQLQETFITHGPYFGAPGISGFDSDIQDEGQQNEAIATGLRHCDKHSMDWSTTLNQDAFQAYYQTESAQSLATFDFDPLAKLAADDIQDGLTSSSFSDFNHFQDIPTEIHLPQTIAPQQTIVFPNASCMPATPTFQSTESAFQTPELKMEEITYNSPVVGETSPFTPDVEQKNPKECGPEDGEDEESDKALARTPSKRSTRRRRDREPVPRWRVGRPYNVHGIMVHDPLQLPRSTNKTHTCKACNMSFDRPEHFKRHRDNTMDHTNRLIALGHPVKAKDPKPYKCKVAGCEKDGIVTGVTRKDNLKPHYQKTHFFEKKSKREDGTIVEARKRNVWVSTEDAEKILGLGEWDARTVKGREALAQGKQPRLDPCKNYDEFGQEIID
ncbi:MAG: hypothetical protein Q9209_006234 [Squamulea sp. 1 TL-2023]